MRTISILILIAYFSLVFAGCKGYAYVEMKSDEAAFDDRIGVMIGISVLTGLLVYFLLRKGIPEQTKNMGRGSKIAMVLLLIVGTLFYNLKLMRKLNEWVGKNEMMVIDGRVTNKIRDTKGKGPPQFRVYVIDTKTGWRHIFETSRRAFDLLEEGNSFNKEFRIGSFGIIYRKEP